MAILLKCGAIFLHIPKTGGNWVSDVLEDNSLVFANIGGRHCGMEQLTALEKLFRVSYHYSKPNKPFFKFCFVRHPLRWYESWYKMMKGLDWHHWNVGAEDWFPPVMLNGMGDQEFNVFVRNVLQHRPGFVTEMYSWYISHGVHFVGRQENIVDDLISVLNFMNIQFDETRVRNFKPVNVSMKMDTCWDPALQEDVERSEYTTYQRFGYKPEIFSPEIPTVTRSSRPGMELGLDGLVQLPLPFAKEQGNAWLAPIPQFAPLCDHINDLYRSPLVLYEDLNPLPYQHALHDDIRRHGNGRYSHWISHLLFASSDNSDPNTNGRKYQIRFQYDHGSTNDSMLLKPYVEHFISKEPEVQNDSAGSA